MDQRASGQGERSGGAGVSMSTCGFHITLPLNRAERLHPDQVATIDGDRSRTWREVADRARRLAGVLVGLGVAPGDRVGLLAPNGDIFTDVLFGTFWAGGVISPLNLRWSVGEIGYALRDSGAAVLIVDQAFVPLVAAIRQEAACVRHVLTTGPDAPRCRALEAALAEADRPEERLRHGDDLAAILYTGGTTGASKGVMLSHRSLMTGGLCFAGAGDSAPGACMMHTAPLFHVGAIAGFLGALLKDTRHVFVPAFEAETVIGLIDHHEVTDVFFVPTMLRAVLDHAAFSAGAVRSLQRIIYGAAPMPPALLDRALTVMPHVGFVQGYGMTETSGSMTLLGPSDHRLDERNPDRVRSVGRPMIAIEVKIVDQDEREVPVGSVGEIVGRGETIMTGYWQLPEETARALRGGWMHTGDLGRMDGEGFLYVVDRLKDMIVTGGENVFSIEVEGALCTHPAVAQCAVIGRPDDHWGETVHAVIVPQPGEHPTTGELLAHCRALIAGYKCPRSFGFRERLPLSAIGKVAKNVLRAELA